MYVYIYVCTDVHYVYFWGAYSAAEAWIFVCFQVEDAKKGSILHLHVFSLTAEKMNAFLLSYILNILC